jgi:hypothetical protein
MMMHLIGWTSPLERRTEETLTLKSSFDLFEYKVYVISREYLDPIFAMTPYLRQDG